MVYMKGVGTRWGFVCIDTTDSTCSIAATQYYSVAPPSVPGCITISGTGCPLADLASEIQMTITKSPTTLTPVPSAITFTSPGGPPITDSVEGLTLFPDTPFAAGVSVPKYQ
jgi:hypothetical protein